MGKKSQNKGTGAKGKNNGTGNEQPPVDPVAVALGAVNLPSGTVDAPAADSHDDIEVGDPQILRPKELPLVVKPAKGKEWGNDAQAHYAGILNGYAYRNPDKWAKKKNVLIARLASLAKEPEKLGFYLGGDNPSLSYKNRVIEK